MSSATLQHHRLMQILALAIGYAALGEVALALLSYTPGDAAPLWPSAGLALGVMLLRPQLWPGIWLGSFLGKLDSIFAATNLHDGLQLTLLHAGVGGSATIQAVVGALLVTRFVGADPPLISGREVGKFLLLAGPVSCVISPSCTMLLMLLTGLLPLDGLLHIWVSWWVGDIIGVYLFAPLAVQWLSNQDHWRSRRRAVSIQLLLMCVAAVLVFGAVNRFSNRSERERFEHETSLVTAAFQRRTDVALEMTRALNGFFSSSETVDDEEFTRFAGTLLANHAEMDALFWVPRLSSSGTVSYPVRYLVTHSGSEFERGQDLAQGALLLDGLEHSARDGAVGSIPLRSDSGGSIGSYVLLAPLYEGSMPAGTAGPERLGHLRGFAGAIVDVDALAAAAVADAKSTVFLPWRLEDRVTDSSRATDSRRQSLQKPLRQPLQIGAREWSLVFQPTRAYLGSQSQLTAWIVLSAGLAFTVLVVGGTLVVSGRTMIIQAEVQARTEELAHINSKLADEVCGHISTEAALNRERELLRLVLDNLGEGILVLNESFELSMANRAAHKMLVRAAGSAAVLDKHWMTAMRVFAADGMTPLTPEELPIVRALRGETIREAEIVVRYGQRTPVRVLMTAQPLLHMGTQRAGAIAIVRDVTEVHKAERLKREFVATVSHELRTPLTSIRGSLGLLSSGSLTDLEKKRRLIEMAVRNTERLTFLINDLLDIEKIEQGGMKFDCTEQALDALVQQAIDAHQGHAQACNVRIRIEGDDVHMPVYVDPQRLLQVLANLLSNAVKFSPPGGEVRVQRLDLGDRCRVAISDRGPGIALEFRDRLFEKFSQADSSDARTKGGTGLGLAISKALIEHMGGTIGFESEPGHGATFYIELPLVRVGATVASR